MPRILKPKAIGVIIALILAGNTCLGQINALRQQIERIIEPIKATVGVAIVKGQDTVVLNGNHHYPMQSTYKFHLALAVLNRIDGGLLSLDQKIHVGKDELLPDTYSPLREKYPDGDIDIPLKEILTYTVAESDNNGCDILFRLAGGVEEVNRYIRATGAGAINIAATEEAMHKDWDTQYSNWSTPLATARLLEKFYQKELLSGANHSFLWNTMVSTTTGPRRIKGMLPKSTIVGHKTGSGPKQGTLTSACNDIGIVLLPNGQHFTIVVFIANTKEEDETNEKIIAEIAKAAWNHFISNSCCDPMVINVKIK